MEKNSPEIIELSDSDEDSAPTTISPKRSSPDPVKHEKLSTDLNTFLATKCDKLKLRTVNVSRVRGNIGAGSVTSPSRSTAPQPFYGGVKTEIRSPVKKLVPDQNVHVNRTSAAQSAAQRCVPAAKVASSRRVSLATACSKSIERGHIDGASNGSLKMMPHQPTKSPFKVVAGLSSARKSLQLIDDDDDDGELPDLEPVKVEERNLVEELFKACRKYAKDESDVMIVNKLRSRLEKRREQYSSMPDLDTFVTGIHDKVSADPNHMHVHLKELYDKIFDYCKLLRPKAVGKSGNSQAAAINGSSHSLPVNYGASTSSATSDALPVNYGASTSSAGAVTPSFQSIEEKVNAKREHYIERLHNHLVELAARIKELDEEELDFDEMKEQDSAYMRCDRLKQRFVQKRRRLCELTGISTSAGRMVDRKFNFEGTRYPEINKEVSKLVRGHFPDYFDIYKVVKNTNEKKQLHMRPNAVKDLARQIFEDVGKELKRRRMLDFEEDFGVSISDEALRSRDPAEQDTLLEKTLKENKKLADNKTRELFDFYVRKQNEEEVKDISTAVEPMEVGAALPETPKMEDLVVVQSEDENSVTSTVPDSSAAPVIISDQFGFIEMPIDISMSQAGEEREENGADDSVMNLRISSPRTVALSQHNRIKPQLMVIPICRDSQESLPDDANELQNDVTVCTPKIEKSEGGSSSNPPRKPNSFNGDSSGSSVKLAAAVPSVSSARGKWGQPRSTNVNRNAPYKSPAVRRLGVQNGSAIGMTSIPYNQGIIGSFGQVLPAVVGSVSYSSNANLASYDYDHNSDGDDDVLILD